MALRPVTASSSSRAFNYNEQFPQKGLRIIIINQSVGKATGFLVIYGDGSR